MKGICQNNIEGCFSKMDTQQREGIVGCCCEILDELEKGIHLEKPIGTEAPNPKICSI